ncbi:MAG: sigma-54 dependent transcriptional regulator [Acidobacteriota bacterium]|jgi:two-component system response regulator PilR (NtrC family)|nr:sigma-54 dependent transcriptional regulator [Acidobacteriota bacterium]
MKAHLLIIDDEPIFREDLASLLRDEGYQCRTAADGEAGLEAVRIDEPDLVVCDLSMPGMDGVGVVDHLATEHPDVAVLLATAHGSLESALTAFRKGVADYLLKPLNHQELLVKINRCLEKRKLDREVRFLRRQVSQADEGTRLIGGSASIEKVRKLIRHVAPTDTSVLVTGETGTGKEVVARSIHELGSGLDAPFVAVNCAALPRELMESELFGHRRGAFSGAIRDKPGMFELASGGSLFLDEIGELPLELQPKLLRALEQREVMPIGGVRPIPTRLRLITATHRNLQERVQSGEFRQDLYYRIRVMEIALPALREHRSDIPGLIEHLLVRINARLKKHVLGVDEAALRVLMAADWPGNVRELENALERAVLLAEGQILGLGDLPEDLVSSDTDVEASQELRTAVRAYEREHIQRVLAATGGNREEAARLLGINPSTLYRRLQRPGLD